VVCLLCLTFCTSIAYSPFLQAKDSIHLFHLYLTKRELASRKLRNRDFAGVDLKELDLVDEAKAKSEAALASRRKEENENE
jgi:hypothetical protein